jgi:hypothetical protein
MAGSSSDGQPPLLDAFEACVLSFCCAERPSSSCCCCCFVCRYANTYLLCLSLLASERVNVLPLITYRFGFGASGVAQGFETAATSRDSTKVMFHLQ